jgi:ribosomal protein S18 acetylase RimI-like enzyme
MLLFDAGRPDVGLQLVRRATDWLRGRSDEAPTYLHPHRGYPFYRGLWFGGEPQGALSFPHVQMALAAGGYHQTHQDVMMVADLSSPLPRFEAACDVTYTDAATPMHHDVHRASWVGFSPRTLTARVDGQWAGECGYVMLPQAASSLGHPSMSIWNLAVDAAFRRRGIAAALISRAQQAAYEAAARTSTVCTTIDNAPAHATYTKCGYRPHTLVNGRTWRADDPA